MGAGHPSTVIIPPTTNVVEDAEPRASGSRPLAGYVEGQISWSMRSARPTTAAQGPLTSLDDSLMARIGDAVGEVLDLQGQVRLLPSPRFRPIEASFRPSACTAESY